MKSEEVTVTGYNKGNSHETEEEISLEEWLGSEVRGGCGNPHPWRYTKLDWKGPGEHSQTLPVFKQEVGLDDLQRCLQVGNIQCL